MPRAITKMEPPWECFVKITIAYIRPPEYTLTGCSPKSRIFGLFVRIDLGQISRFLSGWEPAFRKIFQICPDWTNSLSWVILAFPAAKRYEILLLLRSSALVVHVMYFEMQDGVKRPKYERKSQEYSTSASSKLFRFLDKVIASLNLVAP